MSARQPPPLTRPVALWRDLEGGRPARWKSAVDGWAVGAIHSGLRTPQSPIDRRALELLTYRPDLLTRIGPAALRHPQLRTALRIDPACALCLTTGFYDETAPMLESGLAGSGESVYRLLRWAARHGRALRQPEGFYRQTLRVDTYWGARHALRTRDFGLFREIAEWSADERRDYASAAAFFLAHNPREPVLPYREVLLTNPFYAYVALPRLAARGLSVGPEDIGQPKWACHFALSGLAGKPERFLPAIARDPGWLIEFATARGWLGRPDLRRQVAHSVLSARDGHPLQEPALLFLEEAAAPIPGRGAPPQPRSAGQRFRAPVSLVTGQEAEARALGALRLNKNTSVWRPSPEQVQSPEFRQIVGQPLFTARGVARGTVLDSTESGLTEIKSGSSILSSTYQLRLQTYRSVAEEQPLRILTDRPIDIQFGQWLNPWGVKIEPMPETPQP